MHSIAMFIKLFEVSRQIDPNLEFKFKFKILELSIAYDAYFEYDPYTVHCALNEHTIQNKTISY